MAMRLDFNGLVQYIRQWVKDTAKWEMDEPLARLFTNMAYLESAYRAGWKVEFATITLTAGKGEYSLSEMGLDDLVKPRLVLYEGTKIKDTDFESMAHLGYFKTDATQGVPDAVTFQTGSMTIRPIPDAAAAAGELKLLYSATPVELTQDNLTLDPKFRTCWQETLAWLVLLKVAMLPKEEETRTLFMTPDQIRNECEKRLRMMEMDVWSTAVSARKLKDRSSETDEAYLSNNFYTN